MSADPDLGRVGARHPDEDARVLLAFSDWFSSNTAARLVGSRLYPWADVLWLAVEEAVVLSCAEHLFPALIAQRKAAGVAAVISGTLWLVWRRRTQVVAPLSAEQHTAAMRGALSSVLVRSLLVVLTSVCLGSIACAGGDGRAPLSAVAFLLWCAAAATPLFDAGRALLEYHAAEHALDETRRVAAAASARKSELHALRGQLRKDTLPTRAFLLCLSALGLTISAGLALWAVAAPALEGSDRLASIWFTAPVALLVGLSTSALYIQLRLQALSARASEPSPTRAENEASLAALLWLPRGLAGCTLVIGTLLFLLAAVLAVRRLHVPSDCLVVFLGIASSCLSAAAILQWAIVRWLCDRTRDHLTRTGLVPVPLPHSALVRRLSPALAQRKARRAVSLATLAVLSPTLVSLFALWLLHQPIRWPLGMLVLLVPLGILTLAVITTLRRLRGALRPLTEATRQAAALAASPDDPGSASRVPQLHTKQRTRLATTLLAMQEALRQRLVYSSQAQARLESDVAARTRELLQRNQDIERNIQLLSQAQQALSEAEKLATIGQFVAGIAHEINNPINATLNAARPLREALAELKATGPSLAALQAALADGELAAMVRVVQRGAQRAAEIVRALYSYAERDVQPLESVDLQRTLEDAWELVQHPEKSRVHIVRKLEATRPVQGHAGPLQQVFVNLLGNAVHALSEPSLTAPDFVPTIELGTQDVEDAVQVAIRDNGPGIPRALHTRIFEPFFTTKDVTQGSGLGLAIAHSIVMRHHGRMELTSAPGQGARFVITLPLLQPAANSPKTP
ncbi:MAG: HAMP domain-containing histidine kinase [Myxococcales bacterium]|nr:HAMP domain-containing histidine kinase [Myxococcales bacterium]